uniref:TSA: Wollemia nobilis Ref_Wollemi_Transcript_14951_1694 transcribed RNA sequence n=1 Tax=Wollemia nobilis TaxID=56998 RepID=A0A0C9RSL8_9CONI
MEQQIMYSWMAGLLSLCVVLVIIWLKARNHPKHKLPPRSRGLPFIGDTISLLRWAYQPRKFFDERQRRLGPVFRTSLFGNSRTVVSVDPEFNKYVLANESRLFHAKYPTSFRNLLGKYSLLHTHGEMQRKLHGMAVNLLRFERLSSVFMDDVQDLLRDGMEKWEKKRDIHLQHECHRVVLKLMAKQLLDISPSDDKGEIYEAFQEFTGAGLTLPIKIPGSAYAKGMKAREFLIKMIYKSMEERRDHPEIERNDLLTSLVRDGQFSDEIIADLILFLLFAGYETSSTAMAFAVKFLTENPRALEELKAEHNAILKAKGGEKLTWDDYLSMKFTHCVIKETLRRGNVAPALFRETTQDVKYKDIVIPKGWLVIVFLNAMHMDENNYSQALAFDPWRWENEGHEMTDNPAFIPFGKGARLCPGYHLARLEIALFLHYFVTKFKWEPLEADRIRHFPVPGMEKGLPIRLYLEA